MRQNKNGSVEDSLSMHRNGSNQTVLASEIQYIIHDENFIIAPEKEKTVSILNDEFSEQQAFPYVLPQGKFDQKVPQDISMSPA